MDKVIAALLIMVLAAVLTLIYIAQDLDEPAQTCVPIYYSGLECCKN